TLRPPPSSTLFPYTTLFRSELIRPLFGHVQPTCIHFPRSKFMTENIKSIGIIGAGQMGSGIAHVASLAGYDVKLYDLAQDRLEAGIATVSGNLARQVSTGKIEEKTRRDALSRIQPANSMEMLADTDLVIEAATEDETVKRKIFAQLCPILNPEALIASNTSSISITRLASQTDRPERFIGIHFMNPVPVM